MTRDVQIALLVKKISEILSAAGAEGEAKRFQGLRIKQEERYACVFRAITNVESALRVRWASEGLTGSRLGMVCEVLQLLRCACTAVLSGQGNIESWLGTLTQRVEEVSK